MLVKPRTPSPQTDYERYREKIRIDRDQLDMSVEEQAGIYLSVSEQYVKAVSERDALRDQLARKDAEIAGAVRQKAEQNKSRATEAMINDAVMLHNDHIQLSERLSLAKKEVDLWMSLRDAFDQRMRMLRELVTLYTTGYFSVAGTGKPRNTVHDALADSARQRLSEQRKSR